MKVEHGQSIFDIAVQETGTVESIFEIAEENELFLTQELEAGQALEAQTASENKIIRKTFLGKKINSHVLNPSAPTQAGGIGHMGIRLDFIVS